MKTAIVTGGGSGIGKAIAASFIQQGIRTIIIGRDHHKLEATARELGELCIPKQFDLTQLSLIPSFVQSLHTDIDILVNNAGINMKKDFCDVTDEDFQQVLHTNVMAVFSFTREIARKMLARKSGSVIMISSMASQYGIPKVIAYTASKAAIEGMTRAMAVELSPHGIRINCIAPGFIATDMSATALNNDPERKQKVMSRTPMGHLGAPSDIGATAAFLASDAARYITGAIIPVDGGNSIGF